MRQLKKEATAIDKGDPIAAAIARGVEHLTKQAAQWKPAQTSGEAVRALVIAGAKGYGIGTALDATLNYLKQPAAWPREQRIALGFALAAAERHGRAASTDLQAAAKLLLADQQPDGSFGGIVDTWRARLTLIESGMQPDEVWIILIDRWVRGLTAETATDAAAILLALELSGDVMAENLRRNCLSLLRTEQGSAGGWGPGSGGKPEVFASALAVMALGVLDGEPGMARSSYRPDELTDAIARGKAWLASAQQPDGSWPGASNTGWALLALLSP